MTTEWYRFFWNIYGFTATGAIPVDKGGTGLNTIGNHQLIIGNANNVFEPASLSSASIAITYPTGFINLELGTSGVTPGTYGSASQVGVFTVNAYGVLTAASNTSIGIDASQIISGTLSVIRGGTGQSTYTDGQLLIGNSTGNTLTKSTLTASTGISVTNGAGSITLANTGVLSVSGTAPVVSSGGATPAISMAAATTSVNGYLTSTDWNTFNGKAPGVTFTTGYIPYGQGTTTLNQSANLFFDGTNLLIAGTVTSTLGGFITPTLGTAGLNILASYSYNNGTANTIGGSGVFNQSYILIHIAQGIGLTTIPVMVNGGGGVAYRYNYMNPATAAWASSAASPTISFTVDGTGGNTYSIVLNSGNGSATIQRTAGTAAYTVYTQRLTSI
jgi:hypothetical protein